MKKLLFTLSLAAMSLMATDYSQLSMEELEALRGTIAVEDREDFRAEMQSRLLAMTPEERALYTQERREAGVPGVQDGSGVGAGSMERGSANVGQGIRQRLQDGSGGGSMAQGSRTHGKQ